MNNVLHLVGSAEQHVGRVRKAMQAWEAGINDTM